MSGKRTANFRPRTREAGKVVKAVRKAGGEVTLTANSHMRVEGPDGRATVIGSDFGDPKSFRNAMAKIRRDVGLDLGL